MTRSRLTSTGTSGSARRAKRPFKKDVYHPFNWRGWYDFGTGALGDMACHTVNMPFRAFKLGYPNVVECELASRMYPESFPKTSRIRFEFPERGDLPPLKFWWYDGNPDDPLKPLRPDGEAVREVIATYDKLPGSGALIVGEKGKLFSPDDYGARFFVAMKGKTEYVAGDQDEACKAVPEIHPPLARPHAGMVPHDEGRHSRLFQLRHRGLPDRDHPAGLHCPARRRGQAHGLGRPEHAVAQPAGSGPVRQTQQPARLGRLSGESAWWNDGVVEWWKTEHSNTPSLQRPIPPALRCGGGLVQIS